MWRLAALCGLWLAPGVAWSPLRPLRRLAAASLAPATLLGGGAALSPAIGATPPPPPREVARLRPKAVSIPRPGVAQKVKDDHLLEDMAEFFDVYQNPQQQRGFRFWMVREPWSERPLERKLKDVPVFLITNAAGNPYFTPTADGAVQIGRFYLDPRDAQDMLDEFLQEPSTAGARLSVVSMSRALDIMADTADQNEDQEEEDYLDLKAEVEPYRSLVSGEIDQARLLRDLEEVHRMRFINADEREALLDQEKTPYIIWDFMGSSRSADLYEALINQRRKSLAPSAPQLQKKGEPLALVYSMRGLRTNRGGEEVRPFFFNLDDMGRAYKNMQGKLGPGELAVEGLHWEAFELTDVLKNMLYEGDGWEKVSLEPTNDARRYVREARRNKETLSTKGHLIDPASTIGMRRR